MLPISFSFFSIICDQRIQIRVVCTSGIYIRKGSWKLRQLPRNPR